MKRILSGQLPQDGQPTKEVYLSFINLFGSQGIYRPEDIESATLTLNATDVEKAGEIKAYLVKGATFDTATWADKIEYESDPFASADVEENGICTWDVTPLIKKAVEICTEGCPYSIALVAEDSASVGFASRRPQGEPRHSGVRHRRVKSDDWVIRHGMSRPSPCHPFRI